MVLFFSTSARTDRSRKPCTAAKADGTASEVCAKKKQASKISTFVSRSVLKKESKCDLRKNQQNASDDSQRSIALVADFDRIASTNGRINDNKRKSCASKLGRCFLMRGRHLLLGKARTVSLETKSAVTERLSATWPPKGTVVGHLDDLVHNAEDEQPDEDERLLTAQNSKDAVIEFCIPHEELLFKEMMRRGRFGDVYRGSWHGDVLIYTFPYCQEEKEVEGFWDEVANLSLIRHENIMLFMGACVEPDHLSVITSMKMAKSLFESVHMERKNLSLMEKINVAQEISQAMSYLHAKKMVHKRLNSHNIIMEKKIKVCIMDQGMARYDQNQLDSYGCVPRGQLTYLSPELIRSLNVEPPYLYLSREYTQESDVYAFGTLLYELIAYKFPFSDLESHCIIWRAGNGDHESIERLKCSPSMKTLISNCWSAASFRRPKFPEILKHLQQSVSVHKKFSSSEPEKLHKAGVVISKGTLLRS